MAKKRIRIVEPKFFEEEKEAVISILENHILTRDGWTEQFQREFAKYVGVNYCFTVCSGTVALFIALKALGVDKGETVVVPAMSFMATVDAVLLAGGTPLVIDIDEYYTMDVNQLEDVAKKYNPKVVIPVHLFGQMADMESIMYLSEKYGFFVLEDAAQAHGAEYSGKKAGAWGHVSAFSFYASKNVPMGEGGAVLTDSEEIAKNIKKWIDFGEHPAFNVRITEFQAAIGSIQLKYLDERNERRREIARIYKDNFSEIFGVPKERENSKHVYHLFTMRHPLRDAIIEGLKEKGIDARIYYPYLLNEIRECKALTLENAYKYREEVFSIPVHPFLSDEDVAYIVDSMLEVVSTLKA